jgi:hypothetical protein
MGAFDQDRTPFYETIYPTPGFSNLVYGKFPQQEPSDEAPKESALPPYEFTLGDIHDTHPAEDATRVAPGVDHLKNVLTHLVELPLERPEDN